MYVLFIGRCHLGLNGALMTHLDSSALSILRAIFGMGVLSLVMMNWMSWTRLAGMKQEGLTLKDAGHTAQLRTRMPSKVQRVSDNYSHLFEAPTAFYAVALAIVAAGAADQIYAICAWVFLGARVAHSLVQATINVVPLRLTFYLVSWAALAVMIVRGILTI